MGLGDFLNSSQAEVESEIAGRRPNDRRNRAFACLLVLSLVYAVGEIVPGRFTVTDEVFFKAAGRNWAMTGRWAAPEIVGRLSKGPPLTDVYFAQPPLYTFLYGVYTRLAGFGPRTCMLYDVAIHLLLVWSAVAVARGVYALPWSLCALCGALLIPLGTVGRPDELGIVFAMWGAVTFRSKIGRKSAALIGGSLLGLCGATSLGCFVFLGPLVAWELGRECEAQAEKARNLSLAAMGALAAAAAWVLPILASHPTAYQQLIAHAGEQSAALGLVTGQGQNSGSRLLHGWPGGLAYGFSYGVLMPGLLTFAVLCWRFDKARDWGRYTRILLGVLSLLLLLVVMGGKCLYTWFPGSWLFIACMAVGTEVCRSTSSGRRGTLLAFASVVWLAASLPYLRWKVILWTLPAEQSLTRNWRRLRSEVPAGVGVLGSDYWWALADRDRVYDSMFSYPSIEAVDYIVVSGNGSGKPGTPANVPWWAENTDFRPVENHLNLRPTALFGFRLSRSAYGFGAYVLEKKSRAERAGKQPVSEEQNRAPALQPLLRGGWSAARYGSNASSGQSQ